VAHRITWNAAYEALPADTEAANLLGLRLRNLKQDIRERGEVDHDWDDTADGGKHESVTLKVQGSDPVLTGTDAAVYGKDDGSGDTELYFEDDSGNVVQLTKDGDPITVKKAGDTLTGALQFDNNVGVEGDIAATGSYKGLIKRNASDQTEVGVGSEETLLKGDDSAGLIYNYGSGDKQVWHGGNSVTPFTEEYNSGDLALTGGALDTDAHGLSGTPKLVQAKLKCTDAGGDQGYAQNDEICISSYAYIDTYDVPDFQGGIAIAFDSSNLLYGVASQGVKVVNKSAGTANTISLAKWVLVVLAWY
jgi:hypothetical protein